jgi:8-oxo-dGTP pyrophosphatase MutT (NUDIX family)
MNWTTLTGAGGIVVKDRSVLFVRQRRPYGTFWEFPSGYYEPGESFEETTAREVVEEASIAVEVGELVCTMLWQREHDRRRNVLAYFLATPLDDVEPRPQIEEDIDAAVFSAPENVSGETIHPLHAVILDRWWTTRESGFHVHADVSVNADGTQTYFFRP